MLTKSAVDTIDVGKSEDGEKIFIAFTNHWYEKFKTAITRKRKHALVVSKDDAAWLVRALQKELGEYSEEEH